MKDKFDNVNSDDSTHLEGTKLHGISNLFTAWFHVFLDWLMTVRLNTCNTPICVWLGRTSFPQFVYSFSLKKSASPCLYNVIATQNRGVLLSIHTHMPTIKQKNTKLGEKSLALSTPRWNKQINLINQVWERLLLPCSATSALVEAVSWHMVNYHKSLLLPAAHSLLL